MLGSADVQNSEQEKKKKNFFVLSRIRRFENSDVRKKKKKIFILSSDFRQCSYRWFDNFFNFENLVENEEMDALREDFGIVRPICEFCITHGKKPVTRNAKKGKKRARHVEVDDGDD